MALNCELLPWGGASADELKRLGDALSRWLSEYLDALTEAGVEVDSWADMDAIDALLAGEPPRPFAVRCGVPGMTPAELAVAVAAARSRYTLVRRLLPPVESRAVLFGLSLADDAADEVVESLRRHLPMKLVAAIRINGREYSPLT